MNTDKTSIGNQPAFSISDTLHLIKEQTGFFLNTQYICQSYLNLEK